MEAKKRLLTYAGLKALEDELEHLKVVKRKEVAGKIKEAREQGDLSENAEYDAAKDEQRDIEARIEELEGILKNAEVVVEDEVDFDKINVGCTVKVFDVTFDEEMEFKIVGSTEANSPGRKDLQRVSGGTGADRKIRGRYCRRRNTGWRHPVQGCWTSAVHCKFRKEEDSWENSRNMYKNRI